MLSPLNTPPHSLQDQSLAWPAINDFKGCQAIGAVKWTLVPLALPRQNMHHRCNLDSVRSLVLQA